MPKKTTQEKSSLSAAPKPKKAPAKRAATRKPTAVAKAPAVKKIAKPQASKATPKVSDGDISLRAYYIAERRKNLGWDGDEHSDWVEAKRQLEEEATDQGL